MIDNKYIVAICSIGSGVGQSIIDSCSITNLPITTLGLGNNKLAFGQFDCDSYDYIPSYYSDNYIEKLLKKAIERKVDLIIPGHDHEALIISKNIDKFLKENIKVLASDYKLINICRNKNTLKLAFKETENLFVKSYNLDELISENNKGKIINYPLIGKPLDGFASNHIHIIKSFKEIKQINKELIFQEIAIPHKGDPSRDEFIKKLNNGENLQVSEISIQIITDQNGTPGGKFISSNKLINGAPIEITPISSKEIDSAISKLLPMLQKHGLKGPINIQGRITDHGFKIFEINPRFTGITGLRAKFGFNEVSACIKHWLTNEPIQNISFSNNIIGIRQVKDRVVSIDKIKPNFQNKKKTINHLKILITGSTGSLGKNLIKILKEHNKYKIYTLDRSKEKAKKIHNSDVVEYLSWDDIENDNFNLGIIDTICHLASARPFNTASEIANSLQKANYLFTKSVISGVREIIYTSSQSIYGSSHQPPWTEDMPPEPETPYALHKYSSELLLNSLGTTNPGFKHLSLRFPSLTGPDDSFTKEEATKKIIIDLINGVEIKILDGKQVLGRMHIIDACLSIIKVLELGIINSEALNVSASNNENLLQFVTKSINVIKQKKHNLIADIKHDNTKRIQSTFIDGNRFSSKYDWKPSYNTTDIITDIVKHII